MACEAASKDGSPRSKLVLLIEESFVCARASVKWPRECRIKTRFGLALRRTGHLGDQRPLRSANQKRGLLFLALVFFLRAYRHLAADATASRDRDRFRVALFGVELFVVELRFLLHQ